MRKHRSTILKITITVLGLWYVLSRIDLAAVGRTLAGVDWRWVIVAFVLVNVSYVLRAFRWHLLLQGLGARVRFARLVKLYFVGAFFSAILPAGIGGDAVRIVEAAQDVPTDVAAGTVLLDRMSGLMVQFVIVLLALPFRPAGFDDRILLVVVALALAGLAGGALILEGSLLRRWGGWLPKLLSPAGQGPIAKVLHAIQRCGRRAVAGAFGVSLIFNFLLFGWWFLAGRALGYDRIAFGYYLLVVPIMSVALLLPSIGGLGTREVLAPALFGAAGLNGEQAVALSFLVFIVLRLAGLIGAAVYVVSSVREARARAKAGVSNPSKTT